jgi:acyl carrier protein
MIDSNTMTDQEVELANLIINTLNLDLNLTGVDADISIYGDGFGLDSIDILEVALAISQKYGVKLRADDENNDQIFKSLRSLCAYVYAQKPR